LMRARQNARYCPSCRTKLRQTGRINPKIEVAEGTPLIDIEYRCPNPNCLKTWFESDLFKFLTDTDVEKP